MEHRLRVYKGLGFLGSLSFRVFRAQCLKFRVQD